MVERAPFGVEVVVESGRAVVVVTGEIDMASAPELDAVLGGAIEGAEGALVVDLAGVSFFGSDGVRCLGDAMHRAGERGVALRIRRPSPRVLEVLELTGLAGVLTIDANGHRRA